MAKLAINKHAQSETLTFTLSGGLVLETANELRQELKDAIEGDAAKTIHVNLAGLACMDSAGVGVLLGAYKRVMEHDKDLLLILPENGSVRELLRRLGIDTILPSVVVG